jgi:hypothetical protein
MLRQLILLEVSGSAEYTEAAGLLFLLEAVGLADPCGGCQLIKEEATGSADSTGNYLDNKGGC